MVRLSLMSFTILNEMEILQPYKPFLISTIKNKAIKIISILV
jgi:hypothetical protein